jgi:hypothetical protein
MYIFEALSPAGKATDITVHANELPAVYEKGNFSFIAGETVLNGRFKPMLSVLL